MPKMMKYFPTGFLCLFLLSACGYTGDPEIQHHVYKSQIETVQSAVNQYHKDTGVLPIKTRPQKTPIYQKYPIDFDRLVKKYLPDPPENSYLKGGIYEYVLVNAEKNPTVKVIDLTTVDKVQEVQRRVDMFRAKHGFSPLKDVIVNKRYSLDYKAMGYQNPPAIKSPFTGRDLDFVIDTKSKVHIDYRSDLYAFLKKYGEDYQKGEDIRNILVKHSPFVPVDSFPYTVNDKGEPIFLVK